MARVAAWAQHGSIAHFPTNIERQVFMSPLAEFMILNLQLISGSDRFANLVQWAAYVGTALASYAIATDLGANRSAAMVACGFAATIPASILQATSTQNDLLLAFFLIAAVHFGVRYHLRSDLAAGSGLAFSVAAAIATKGYALAYLGPMAVVLATVVIRRDGVWRKWVPPLLLAALGTVIVNAGHWWRNYSLYQHPLGPKFLRVAVANETHAPAALVSNVVRQTLPHVGVPSARVREVIERVVFAIHKILGIDPLDPRTTAWPSPLVQGIHLHEDKAGNNLHLLIITLGFAGLALSLKRGRLRSHARAGALLAIASGGWFTIAFMLKWQPWVQRFHIAAFVLAAPAIGLLCADYLGPRAARTVLIGLAISALPFLVLNVSHPLVSFRGAKSAFIVDTTTDYLRNRPYLQEPLVEAVRRLQESGCHSLALRTGPDAAEYAVRALATVNRLQMVFHHVDIQNVTSGIAQHAQPACAILELERTPHGAAPEGFTATLTTDDVRLYQPFTQAN